MNDDRDHGGFDCGGEQQSYTEDELVDWLEAFVLEFGYVPKSSHIAGWPGPSVSTYLNHFGSWDAVLDAADLPNAVREQPDNNNRGVVSR